MKLLTLKVFIQNDPMKPGCYVMDIQAALEKPDGKGQYLQASWESENLEGALTAMPEASRTLLKEYHVIP